MAQGVLPKTNETGSNEWADVYANDKALLDLINGNLEDDNLSGSADISRANLSVDAKPIKWYAPVIIAGAQTRNATSFGTLTTPDVVPDVEVPEGGLVVISYAALVRSPTVSAIVAPRIPSGFSLPSVLSMAV